MRSNQQAHTTLWTSIALIGLFVAGAYVLQAEAGASPGTPAFRLASEATPTPGYEATATEESEAQEPEATPTLDDGALEPVTPSATAALQASSREPQFNDQLLSDGQFVWGPNVGEFDVAAFLASRNSSLEAYADFIEGTARYAGINPRVLLAALEARYGMVTAGPGEMDPDAVRAQIESLSLELHRAFYEHLYNWGSRRAKRAPDAPAQAAITLAGGESIQVAEGLSSASYAIAAAAAPVLELTGAEDLSAQVQGGFGAAFEAFFPEVDPLDTSNDINPDTTLPDDFFQFPFPLNAVWRFSGVHSWGGGGGFPDRSSMDFMTTWSNFPNYPYKNTVAAAGGDVYIWTPSQDPLPCWVEIFHGDGWSTSYYHLINIGPDSGWMDPLNQNQLIGSIGTETCNDGFATGAHVHFTLWYNGALVDLDGFKLSGWTIHEGPRDENPYQTGYIERDGVIKTPYNTVLNDHHLYYGHGLDYSLRFFGNTSGDVDRLKMPLEDFDPNEDFGTMTDVGAHDFTVEWWLKADPGANDAAVITCGANDNWKQGDVILDRSRGTGRREWGVSIAGGKIAFGVTNSGGSDYTLCSSDRVDDGEWHHIVIQRNRYDSADHGYIDGQLWVYIDGVLQGTVVGPIGNLSYPDGAAIGSNCGPGGSQACVDDPYLVIGASKYNTSGAFNGWIDDLRFSAWVRYPANFSPPAQPLQADAQTVGLFSFNEGAGDVLYDTGGYDGGASTADRYYGGSPAGPVWTTIVPFVEYQHIYLPLIAR